MALRSRTKNRNPQVHNAILEVDKIKAVRAVYESPNHQEAEVKIKTRDNEVVILRLPSNLIPTLIGELTDVHEAINPPLYRGSRAAQWDGM